MTERVTIARPGAVFETVVLEEKLDGTQTVTFEPADDGARVDMQLDYRVHAGRPARAR